MVDTRHRLSALVVIHNEEEQLAACLDGVKFADEIVVVLDDCTDGSKTIADDFGSKLVEGNWEIEGDRRNTGIEACAGDWILEVDADERVPSDLATEIRGVIGSSNADWHDVPVDNYLGERLIRYGWGASFGRGAHAALYRKGAKKWGRERVHPKLTFTGNKGDKLKSPITHYVDRDISGLIRKLDSYSTAHAQDLRASGDIGSFGHNIRRIFSRFYKCYVARRGYREGPYGFLIALLAGMYPILSYLKARLEDDPEIGNG
jgi:glycosyltransferase involved in cell wall biosynthesis